MAAEATADGLRGNYGSAKEAVQGRDAFQPDVGFFHQAETQVMVISVQIAMSMPQHFQFMGQGVHLCLEFG